MNIFGNGIDIVSIKRLEKMVSSNSRFLPRLLTEAEIDYCRGKRNHLEHAAGRIALKEAVYKALKVRGITLLWKDMEIESAGSPPVFSKSCPAAKKLSREKISYSFSISHERKYAVASAIFWEEK